MAVEPPSPATISGTTSSPYAIPGSAIRATQPMPMACSANPATSSGRSPTRSAKAPATVAVGLELAAVWLDQPAERRLVALPGGRQEVGLGRCRLGRHAGYVSGVVRWGCPIPGKRTFVEAEERP